MSIAICHNSTHNKTHTDTKVLVRVFLFIFFVWPRGPLFDAFWVLAGIISASFRVSLGAQTLDRLPAAFWPDFRSNSDHIRGTLLGQVGIHGVLLGLFDLHKA